MKITRMGHAALLIQAADTRLLIDPGNLSMDETFDLQGLDGIVVTHQHPDHLDTDRIASLLERNVGATLLCDPETADLTEHGRWTAHADGDETSVGNLMVRGVGTRHAVILPQLPRIANTGVLVSGDGEPTLFHPGDAYEQAPDEVDVLALPLGAPWAKISETVDFVARVSPAVVFPVHDATISERAYGLYWGHIQNFGGVADARRLGPTEATIVE